MSVSRGISTHQLVHLAQLEAFDEAILLVTEDAYVPATMAEYRHVLTDYLRERARQIAACRDGDPCAIVHRLTEESEETTR
jgi:hypothetical protein